MLNSVSVVSRATTLPLVEIRNDRPITSSLRVAEHFQKAHGKVLRDIRNLECSERFKEANFGLTLYNRPLANQGYKKSPMYYITRDGFTFLAMGFTGKVAAKFKEDYINAFNAMEAKLRRMHAQADPTRYVPMQQYREQVRLAEFEKREAAYWYKQSQTYLGLFERSVDNMRSMSERMLELSRKPAIESKPQPTRSDWMTVVGYATLHNIPCGLNMAARLGRKATDLCTRQGIVPDTIPDPRFGRVNTYPMHVLEEVFAFR